MIINLIGSLVTLASIVACLYFLLEPPYNTPISVSGGTRLSFLKWISTIFLAGMGVSLVCTVPSSFPIIGALTTTETYVMLLLYNGIPVWCLYSLVGIFYLLDHNSLFGKVLLVLSTIFGMAISVYAGISVISTTTNSLIIMCCSLSVLVVLFYFYHSYLSLISTVLFIVLAIDTIFNGTHTSNIINGDIDLDKILKFYFLSDTSAGWWFWWISWSPVVGKWLATISNGRTIREYLLGSIFAPSLICGLWITICYKYEVQVNYLVILLALLFLAGTFSSNLHGLSKVFLNRKKMILFYSIVVGIPSFLYLSRIIEVPWEINNYIGVGLIVITIIWLITRKERSYYE